MSMELRSLMLSIQNRMLAMGPIETREDFEANYPNFIAMKSEIEECLTNVTEKKEIEYLEEGLEKITKLIESSEAWCGIKYH